MSKASDPTEVCPTCGGNNGVHLVGCSDAPVAEPQRVADRRLSETTQLALAVDRISKALAAVPMNIALGALATVVGQAHFKFQGDRRKREHNLDIFMGAVRSAIAMTEQAEDAARGAKLQEQTADPIRKLDS